MHNKHNITVFDRTYEMLQKGIQTFLILSTKAVDAMPGDVLYIRDLTFTVGWRAIDGSEGVARNYYVVSLLTSGDQIK